MSAKLSLREVLDRQTSEGDLQDAIVAEAKARGWLVFHDHDSRHGERGFPDLVLVRVPRIIFAELKDQKRKPTHEQTVWLGALEMCDGAETYLWRPSDRDAISAVLA